MTVEKVISNNMHSFVEFIYEQRLLLNKVDLLVEKESFKDGLYEYRNSDKHLFHFSDKNRVGVNPRYRYSTPLGVYGYVASDIYPDIAAGKDFFGHNRQFCHVLEMISNNILYLQQFQIQPNLEKIREIFDEYNPEPSVGLEERLEILKQTKYDDYPIRSEGDLFWKLFHYCVYPYEYRISADPDIPIKRAPIMFNTMLRKMGYDIVIDNSGTIHKLQETQGILLVNSAYKQVKTIERFV